MTSQSRTTTTLHSVSHSTLSATATEGISSSTSIGHARTKGCSCSCSPYEQLLCSLNFFSAIERRAADATESADYRFTERELDLLSPSDLWRLAVHLLAELAKRDRRVQGGDHA